MTEKPRKRHLADKIAERMAREQNPPPPYETPEIGETERREPKCLTGPARWADWNPYRGD